MRIDHFLFPPIRWRQLDRRPVVRGDGRGGDVVQRPARGRRRPPPQGERRRRGGLVTGADVLGTRQRPRHARRVERTEQPRGPEDQGEEAGQGEEAPGERRGAGTVQAHR